MTITNDIVTACCERFALKLMQHRAKKSDVETQDQVKVAWESVPMEHRVAIKSLTGTDDLI